MAARWDNVISITLHQVATQLSSRGWVDPIPDLIHILKICGSAGDQTRDLMISSHNNNNNNNNNNNKYRLKPPREPHR